MTMHKHIHELPELEDILHKLCPIEEKRFFNEEEALEIYDTCVFLMEEFVSMHPKLITEPDFEDVFDENISELMHCHFDFDVFYTEEAQEEMDEIIEVAKNDFYKELYPLRSYSSSIILCDPDYEFIKEQIDVLRGKPQPVQRTKEWYEMRQNLITASNAYKAFENQNTKNQLIFEKCQTQSKQIQPIEQNVDCKHIEIELPTTNDVQMVNVNSTLHWGQKYEPLSVMYYEYMYDTKVEDFGCIQHDKYKFLGASPDGINVDPNSKRYGRMLEIKNIVNREIDGIPKKEYWIQMQLQMEVCDLDECDFLETRFTEYPDYQEYLQDTATDEIYEDEEGNEFCNTTNSKDDKQKGIIVYFHTKEGKPYYEYKPLDIVHPDDIQLWEEKVLDLYQGEQYKYIFVKFIYWKLDEYSCVLVQRNRQWFENNIAEMEELWSVVLKERQDGYEHRAPNSKRSKKDTINVEKLDVTMNVNSGSSGCLLKFIKPIIHTNLTNSIYIPIITNLELNIDNIINNK
uniref:YqaJ viral recombinase domain-containing protein n=1 Tax=viral metagenome TaxID=1070528 RepID=A0A6C0ITW2_9ZZZZ